MNLKIFKFSIIFFFFTFKVIANTQYFNEGLNLYEEKKLNEAKFKFEQDIVFNPKSEMSYLYLAKIFKSLDKIDLAEQNLNTVILLNPKNEEAIFNLGLLKIRKSNYDEAKKLIETFKKVCNNSCNQLVTLQKKLDTMLKK